MKAGAKAVVLSGRRRGHARPPASCRRSQFAAPCWAVRAYAPGLGGRSSPASSAAARIAASLLPVVQSQGGGCALRSVRAGGLGISRPPPLPHLPCHPQTRLPPRPLLLPEWVFSPIKGRRARSRPRGRFAWKPRRAALRFAEFGHDRSHAASRPRRCRRQVVAEAAVLASMRDENWPPTRRSTLEAVVRQSGTRR